MSVPDAKTISRERMRRYLADERQAVLHTVAFYAVRMGAATRQSALTVAEELLHELVIEALRHADRYNAAQADSPRAWLLGIALNLIRRRQRHLAVLDRREPLVRDLVEEADAESEDDLFDRLATLAAMSADPADVVEANAALTALLDSVSLEDQRVLRLAVVQGLNGEALAHELGISPGAARVRLHRAIRRLRAAQQAATGMREGRKGAGTP